MIVKNIDLFLDDIQHGSVKSIYFDKTSKVFDLAGNNKILIHIEDCLWYAFHGSSKQNPFSDPVSNANELLTKKKYDSYFNYIIRKHLELKKKHFLPLAKKEDVEKRIDEIKDYYFDEFCIYYVPSADSLTEVTMKTSVLQFLKHLRNSYAHGAFNYLNQYWVILDYYKSATMGFKMNNGSFALLDDLRLNIQKINDNNTKDDILKYCLNLNGRSFKHEKINKDVNLFFESRNSGTVFLDIANKRNKDGIVFAFDRKVKDVLHNVLECKKQSIVVYLRDYNVTKTDLKKLSNRIIKESLFLTNPITLFLSSQLEELFAHSFNIRGE